MSIFRSKKFGQKLLYLLFFFILGNRAQVMAQGPAITSISPATACQGETITITGTGFTGATSVKLGSTTASSFTVVSETTITAVVGDAATTGAVSVTTPGGSDNFGTLTVKPSPKPLLNDISNPDGPFTNCDGNATYVLTVSNGSTVSGTGNGYTIDWGDNSGKFTQTDWPSGGQTSHTYTSQGYFTITMTIAPSNGCTRTATYRFYNGINPLASLTTTNSTTGLCVPASIEFQVGNWYNNSTGTTYQLDFGDGTTTTLNHPLNGTASVQKVTHQYLKTSCPNIDFTVTLKAINGCFTTTYTLNQIVIRQKPEADFSTSTTPVCISAPVCFTNKTTNGYSGSNTCSQASVYKWDFGDGKTSGDAAPACHTFPAAGTYPVTLTASNNSCGSSAVTKNVIVLPTSPIPVAGAGPIVYCQGSVAVPLAATGVGLLWYSFSSGGVGSTVAPTPSTSVPGTFVYYVSQTVASSCESPRVAVTVQVNAKPAAPVVTTPVQLCLGQTASPLTATGSGLLWYDVAAGGTGSTTPPTPSTASLGSTTYYVSQTVNGCEGPRAAIVATVNALATAPGVVSPVVYCQGAAAVALTATGTGLRWYTDASGGAGSSVAPIPSTNAAGSTTYYVSQTTGCGEGPRAAITVTVNARPSASFSYTPSVLCNFPNTPANPNGVILPVLTGGTGGVFGISPAGMGINAATGEINPAGASPGVYTISYTLTGSGGCGNFVTTTQVTVNGAPASTISYLPICGASSVPAAVQLSGSQGGTFSSDPGLAINATTGAISPLASTPGTYTVTYTIAASPPCPGYTTTTSVTVTAAPSASISYAPAVFCNVIDVAGSPNPPVGVVRTGSGGGVYTISPSVGLPIDAASGALTPSGATPGVYTITYTVPGSGGCSNFVTTTRVTVNGTPTATISYPPMCGASQVVVPVTLTGSQGGTFSGPPGLMIVAGTGAISPGASTPGTYTVTYTIAASSPCPGYSTSTNVTITAAPSAAIGYTPAVVCNVADGPDSPNPPVAVVRTGSAGGVFTIAPSPGLAIDPLTGAIDPSGARPGVYTVTYTVPGTGSCGDFTTTATVTVNGAPSAGITYPGSPYCRSASALQQVALTGTTGGVYTAGAGLSIDAVTGAIDPSRSLPGSYTVTYTVASSPPCPGTTATARVEIDDSPGLSFSISSAAICSGGTANFLPVSTVANTVYTWAVDGALPAGVSGVSSGTASGANAVIPLRFTNTGTATQVLTITVTGSNAGSNPCPGVPYRLTLTVYPVAIAPDAASFNFCMGDAPVALSIPASPGAAIRWYDDQLNLLGQAPVVATSLAGQTTYYISQLYSNGCESPKSPVLAVVHPTARITGSSYSNPSACGIPSGSISLQVEDLNGAVLSNFDLVVHYNKFQTPYAVSAQTNGAGNVTIALTAGTYSNIYVEANGCTSQKIPDVFILKDPNPPLSPVAGYNPPICSETILNLTALSATSPETGAIQYVWAGPAFGSLPDTVSSTVISFPSASVSYAGTYVVYAVQHNCISSPTSFQVVIRQSPVKPVISTRSPLCVGDELVLHAASSIPGSDNTLEYVWSGPGRGFPVDAANAGISGVVIGDAGVYSIRVTSPATGCSSTTDTLIQIGDYPIVRIAQDSVTVPTGFLLRPAPEIVNAADPGVLPMASYVWTPADGVSCNNAVCDNPTIMIAHDGCYSVRATNVYGCSGRDTICVRVFCQSSQVFIPNAFTPKGDIAANRILMVRASGIAAVRSFRVFNRWGKIVFERNNFPPNSPAFGWDGTVNGRASDPGVYVYTVEVVCENGVPYTFKGNVTLL